MQDHLKIVNLGGPNQTGNPNQPILVKDRKYFQKVEEKAAQLNQKVLGLHLTRTQNVTYDSRVEVVCNICNTQYTASSVRGFLAATKGCAHCINNTQRSKNQPLMWPMCEEHKEKARQTRALNREKKEQEKQKQLTEKVDVLLGTKGTNKKAKQDTLSEKETNHISLESREIVMRVYGGCCCITGTRGTAEEPLHLHHLYSKNSHPQLCNDPRNIVPLKKGIHQLFHQKYYYGNNTPAQFEAFCLAEYNLGVSVWNKWGQTGDVEKRISNEKNFHQKNFEKLIESRGHIIVKYTNPSGTYEGQRSTTVLIKCCTCQNPSEMEMLVDNYRSQIYGLKCCANRAKASAASIDRSPEALKALHAQRLINLEIKVTQNGHILSTPLNSTSIPRADTVLLIECPKHKPGEIEGKMLKKYLTSPCGLACCSNAAAQETRDRNRKTRNNNLKDYLTNP